MSKLLYLKHEYERRPTSVNCQACSENFHVYNNPKSNYYLKFTICFKCAARKANIIYPGIVAKLKNGKDK